MEINWDSKKKTISKITYRAKTTTTEYCRKIYIYMLGERRFGRKN